MNQRFLRQAWLEMCILHDGRSGLPTCEPLTRLEIYAALQAPVFQTICKVIHGQLLDLEYM
jgi:hypothetical protein